MSKRLENIQSRLSDYLDAGAHHDEPVKGIKQGDILHWYDQIDLALKDDDYLRHGDVVPRETGRDSIRRCRHGNALADGGGEHLEPPCGCRYTQIVNVIGDLSTYADELDGDGWYNAANGCRAAIAEIKKLRAAAEPFASNSAWGQVLAWIVEGAPDRQQGLATAKRIVEWQCAVDTAIAEKRYSHPQATGHEK